MLHFIPSASIRGVLDFDGEEAGEGEEGEGKFGGIN